MASVELDRDDVLRFVTAEAKKLKIENQELTQKLGAIEKALLVKDDILRNAQNTIADLERLLEEATKPKTVTIAEGDSLSDDLRFLGYPAPAGK